MPKLSPGRIPAYSRHKASGQAVVTLSGRDVYLGRYGTAESREAYNRVVAEWQANGRTMPDPEADLSILDLIDRYWEHVQTIYRCADGTPTSEVDNFRQALRFLKKLYGRTAASDFGPLALKAVRAEMMKTRTVKDPRTGKTVERPGLARKTINNHVNRICLLFKWAQSDEVVAKGTHENLKTVQGLKAGRSAARETEPVRPVKRQWVKAIKRHVSRQVWAMIRLQMITGARGGELFIMRPCDIRRRRKVWIYRPTHHKTKHRGHKRKIRLGPKAQKILKRFLKDRAPGDFVFSPAEAEQERRDKQHRRRVEQKTTPLSCGNVPGSNVKKKPKRKPGNRYNRDSYARAIARACIKANVWEKGARVCGNDDLIVGHWHPHQLRHLAGTEIRRKKGLEAAQVLLGHRTLSVTQVYAEKNARLADEVAAELG